MMQFVCTGPELILIEPINLLALEKYFISEHLAKEYKGQDLNEPVDFQILLDQLRDNDSVVFISNRIDHALKDYKLENVLITHSDISQLMIGLLNHDEKLIKRIQRSARDYSSKQSEISSVSSIA